LCPNEQQAGYQPDKFLAGGEFVHLYTKPLLAIEKRIKQAACLRGSDPESGSVDIVFDPVC